MKKRFLFIGFVAGAIIQTAMPCSIVGYIGGKLCKNFVREGLARLEYRGYDSAGFACLDKDSGVVQLFRAQGQLDNLAKKMNESPVDGYTGIGHTRWATHGEPSEKNAHPHCDATCRLAVVHNGIIENFSELKKQLQHDGCEFKSDTDTEVIAHLFSQQLQQKGSLFDATKTVVNTLEGAFAFIGLLQEYPDTLIAVRRGSPLCLGIGNDEVYVASDFLAFAGYCDKVIFVPNNAFVVIKRNEVQLYDFAGNSLPQDVKQVNVEPAVYQKLGHEHYMLKEIYEQPAAIKRTIDHYHNLNNNVWKQLGISKLQARKIKSISIIGCGTSWHAACIAQFFFEMICHIPTRIYLASEFRYMPFFPEEDSLYITISQSGETADTLEAARLINQYGLPIITLTNVASSSMVRETGGALIMQAGPEIAVASTKAFSAQLISLYWLANRLAVEKGLLAIEHMDKVRNEILHASIVLQEGIDKYELPIIEGLAKKYAQAQRFMFLGRHIVYPFAMEASLKLKEISYIFAIGYPAGELKHGSIALVDIATPVVLFSHLDPIIYTKLIANAQEIKARKGHLVVFAFEGQEELIKLADQAFVLPPVAPLLAPLAFTGLMQFFVYQIAKTLGCDIDKPRNLAKAVTVE